MNRKLWLMAIAGLCFSLASWAVTSARMAQHDTELSEALKARTETERLARLVGKGAPTTANETDLIPMIHAALSAAGASSSSLTSLRNRGSGRTRKVEVHLSGLTAASIAQWYEAFRAHAHQWKAEEVTLTPQTISTLTVPANATLDATILLAISR
jgi:hypothetical protein